MFKFIKNAIDKIRNYNPAKPLALLFLFNPILIGLNCSLKLDNDFWFIANCGRYILNQGFIHIEPFTIHEGLNYIPQQWLTCVLFYKMYSVIDFSIILFVILLFVLTTYIFYKLCMLISDDRLFLSIIITFISMSILGLFYIRSRPQMFDYVLFLAMFYVLELFIRKKNEKVLYVLPVISVLVINLHSSSFFVMFLLLLPYLISSFKFKFLFLESEGYPKKKLFLVTLIMLFVGFVNPYGLESIVYIFNSFSPYINQIVQEMSMPTVKTFMGIIIYTNIFLILLIYFIKNKNIKLRYFLLFLGTMVLSLFTIKGYSFFLIASIFPIADYLSDDFKEYQRIYKYSKDFKIKYVITILIMIIVSLSYSILNYHSRNNTFVTNITNYLIENNVEKSSKIYTNYDDGGYLEYFGYKTYIDARAEVFLKSNNKKEDIMKEYFLVEKGKMRVKKFIDKYDFDYMVVYEEDFVYNYLSSRNNRNYKMIYQDKKARRYLYKKVYNN